MGVWMSETAEIIKMSKKGQLVVPKKIREEEGFKASDRFVALPIEDGVIFKRVRIDMKKGFEEFQEEIQQRFEDQGIERDEVRDAIKWARKQKKNKEDQE